MMISDFISKLRQENVRIRVNGNDLTVSSLNGKIDENLLQELKDRKSETVAYLQKSQTNYSFESIPITEKQESYPLSFAQQRLWVHNQFLEEQSVYNMLSAIRLKGKLDIDAFRKAFSSLTLRHEVLRTAINSMEGKPEQVILEEAPIEWVYCDLTDHTDQQSAVSQLIQQSVDKKFDLGVAPLVRMQLLKLDDLEHILLLNIHHLIADGWSIDILLKDLIHFYNPFDKEGQLIELPQLRIQYKDYVQWQRKLIDGDYGQTLSEFWKNYLSGDLPILSLPYDHPRPVVRRDQGATASVKIDLTLAKGIRELSKQQGVSLFMLMTSVAKILFYRYSHQRDVIIGTTTGGREHTDLENIVGLFINAVPIRTVIDPDMTFDAFLREVRTSTTKAFEHKAYPFDLMVKDLNLARDPGRHPLFDVMVIMQNTEMDHQDFGSIEMNSIPIQKAISKFDLTLAFSEQEDGIGFTIEYNTDLFEPETVDRMMGHFIALCDRAISSPDSTVGNLCFIPSDEEYQLRVGFNQTTVTEPKYPTILNLFEEVAEDFPTSIAVAFDDKQFTYGEINEKANRLASYLGELEIGVGDFVGIHLERGVALVISMLGVMKSGAAFVPLDTGQQGERLTYMMSDSSMELLIVQSHLLANVGNSALDTMIIDEQDLVNTWLEGYETTNPECAINAEQAAYVIYTSGSTGNPKGCVISHGNLLNYINWANRYFFEGKDAGNFGLFTSIGFDFTLTCIFSPLTRGKLLFVFPPNLEITEVMKEVFDPENPIDVVKLTPSHVSLLGKVSKTNVQTVIVGGEALKEVHIDKLKSISPDLRVINEYGPTEATIGCVAKLMEADNRILIGSPIDNTRIYILDEKLQLVPIGVEGELCIAGAGVALKYINQESLTTEKFVDHPYEPGERLYRSGDKARWLVSGEIEYLGRLDEQVKIRGYRVEPGEIEQQLVRHELVSEAVVIAKPDEIGNTYLDAYIDAEEGLDVVTLHNFLSQNLPEYMIPAHFIAVDQIPLTSNGKADRKALLELKSTSMSLGNIVESPRNAVERLLVDIWQELLNTPEIGINDNFFHLGGDSIKAIQLSSKMQKSGLQVDLNSLFQHPTIKSLSAQIKRLEVESPQGPVTGSVPLTPIQCEFFCANHPEKNHYNQSVMLFSETSLVEEHIQTVLQKLCVHHDALRLRLDISEQPVEQWYDDQIEQSFAFSKFDLKTVDSPEDEILVQAEKIQESLSIKTGPILHCGLFHTSKGDHLLIVVHHLIVDGVSWRILLEDFVALYQHLVKEKTYQLPAKTSSYQQWAAKLHSYAKDSVLLDQLDYWRHIIDTPVADLPKDAVAEENSLAVTMVQSMYLGSELTEKLVSQVHQVYDSQINDLLLTALALSINEWNGADTVRVHLEGHGREALFDELNLNRTMGWFTSLFPVLLPVKNLDSLGDSILDIKKVLRKVPDKGVGYGVLNYLASDHPEHEISLSMRPEIVFNYLGQFDENLGNSLLVPSHVSSGRNKSNSCFREQVLGINGSITNGRLHLRFDYNKHEFADTTIASFVVNFQQHLERIIYHCEEMSSGFPTNATITKKTAIVDEDQIGLVLNSERPQKIFAFPSLYGMAIGYASLARELDSMCMIAYDFIDDQEWRERYYQATKAHQPVGPYVFFGYSGGAILAYEMAAFFESKGESVSDIILVDQAPILAAEHISKTTLSDLADDMLNPSDEVLRMDSFGRVLLSDPGLMKTVRNGIIAYKRLLSQLKTEGSIKSNIHLILEEDDNAEILSDKLRWDQFSSGNVHHVLGSGTHRQMLVPPHSELNVGHIKSAIKRILTTSKPELQLTN